MSVPLDLSYGQTIETAVGRLERRLNGNYILSRRAIALLLLQEDEDIMTRVEVREGDGFKEIMNIVKKTRAHYEKPLNYVITLARQQQAAGLAEDVLEEAAEGKRQRGRSGSNLRDYLSGLTMNPVTGIPILLLVLYFGLYQFVGVFGGGTVVDFLETELFEKAVNPWVNSLAADYLPWGWLQDLLANEYGIITLGIRYAVALILPIVGSFFLFFSLIEDSGYLPRLAMLVDRVFKKVGLSGRAVIPMTLGFGCDTMATMVSRVLETKRERVITTLLLALAIPCSAQLGVILGLLSAAPAALFIWVFFILLVFLLIGYLTARVLPGKQPCFYLEVPPLRWPKLSNVLSKTLTRMQWYFMEVVPLFILASILIWAGNLTGLFTWILNLLVPVVNLIGLPEQAAEAFLFGFFRRDYGAAGLYDLHKSGLLSARQLAVAASTLTLFVPCIAQFSIMIKERGVKTAAAIVGFIFPFAFIAGYVLNWILLKVEVLV